MAGPEVATTANASSGIGSFDLKVADFGKDITAGVGGLDLSAADFGRGATYLGIGVVAGILAKKYLRVVITGTVIALLLLKGLEHRNILTVDWVALKNLIGLEAAATFDSVFTTAFEWFKAQSFVAISSIVGFLIGYKAG
jgi:uncharacterized membrane protein (Fun14 family)